MYLDVFCLGLKIDQRKHYKLTFLYEFMKIKSVDAKAILDSRKEKTIQIIIQTNAGKFSASSPNGKSKGKYESKPYKKNIEEDIKSIKK